MDEFEMDESKRRHIAPNKHLNNSLSVLYYMGMWPEQSRYRYLYSVYTIFSGVFLLGIFLTTEIAYFIANWNDMAKVAAISTVLMTNATHASKVIILVYRHSRIRDLVNVTRSEMFNRDNVKYEQIVTHYTWQGIFHHIAYQTFGALAVTVWGITPVLDYLTGGSKHYPVEGLYPYNVTATPAFEITCSYQAVAIILCCLNNVAIDTLITGLITIACCQLTILNRNISSLNIETDQQLITLKGDANPGKFATQLDNESYKNLKICIKHSNMIFDFSREIQNIFGTAIFFQFLVNCIIICLIAFNMAQMKVYIPHILFGMLMYMCCMTYQIFIYCWHGNELYLHSLDMILAAYSNEWWQKTENFKRAIQIIMTRAQRPLILSAGNIMDISLQNFVRILRMSYSIFTVLQTSTNS
ncbi:odorant receptor Or1 isoform X4 [Nomia melanderi]|uniref:odorant receptor Or1 isoform X4 n=1 Tax=Nomia melanderi TaxID=2448451 RepID=UPI003FCD5ABE